MDDLISRQAAIDALWEALYEFEDKTEKQFRESDELDVADWFQHRIFVQNMNDIDRRTLLELPSADAVQELVRCKDCKWWKTNYLWNGQECKVCGIEPYKPVRKPDDYCSYGERKDDE